MNSRLAIRAALVQAGAVIVLSLALAALLPHSFFEDWGWLTGTASWFGCALVTGAVLGLGRGAVLIAAAASGVLAGVAVVAGVHWLGVAIAVIGFGAFCGWTARRGGRLAWTSG